MLRQQLLPRTHNPNQLLDLERVRICSAMCGNRYGWLLVKAMVLDQLRKRVINIFPKPTRKPKGKIRIEHQVALLLPTRGINCLPAQNAIAMLHMCKSCTVYCSPSLSWSSSLRLQNYLPQTNNPQINHSTITDPIMIPLNFKTATLFPLAAILPNLVADPLRFVLMEEKVSD